MPTPEEDRERVSREFRTKEFKTPMVKKTWAIDWEYPLAKGIKKLFSIFRKEK